MLFLVADPGFLRRGLQSRDGGTNLLFAKFSKYCMKMNKFGPRRGFFKRYSLSNKTYGGLTTVLLRCLET